MKIYGFSIKKGKFQQPEIDEFMAFLRVEIRLSNLLLFTTLFSFSQHLQIGLEPFETSRGFNISPYWWGR